MSDGLAKIDMADVSTQIRERIKLAFVDAISPEQWDEMINGELRKFTRPQIGKDESELSRIARGVFGDLVKEKLTATLKGELEKDDSSLKDAIVEWLDANRDAIISSMLQAGVNSFGRILLDAAMNATSMQLYDVKRGVRDPNNPLYDLNGNYIG